MLLYVVSGIATRLSAFFFSPYFRLKPHVSVLDQPLVNVTRSLWEVMRTCTDEEVMLHGQNACNKEGRLIYLFTSNKNRIGHKITAGETRQDIFSMENCWELPACQDNTRKCVLWNILRGKEMIHSYFIENSEILLKYATRIEKIKSLNWLETQYFS